MCGMSWFVPSLLTTATNKAFTTCSMCGVGGVLLRWQAQLAATTRRSDTQQRLLPHLH